LDSVEVENDEEKIGVDIVRLALEQPVRWLAKNAGEDDGYVVKKIEERLEKEKEYGYNALTGEFGNMIESGILDPFKVSRSALQNAASVAAMVLTTEVLISDIPEKEEKKAPAEGGMPEGMGGY
jgi:chaperonin GroEL